jgi:N-acetylgalactosamine-N,N'-diacetylbacillosaminyl-diphospho-undecaprenol 4-alpha-N-acetylgalactosaminyltransferase
MQLELEQLIEKLNLKNQVFLMGFDSNPYKYLKVADLFVFGSNHEGFPNVLLEAMACSLPILSTNCQSGPSEIMQLEEEKDDLMITAYGILVPIKNANLMAKGIEYFLKNENYIQTCKVNAQKRIKDFEKDHILKKYLDLIKAMD